MGFKIQAWAEGESKHSMVLSISMTILLMTQAGLESRLPSNDHLWFGESTIDVKCWPTEHGHSFETSIEYLRGLTDDTLLNQQVCIAIVRML